MKIFLVALVLALAAVVVANSIEEKSDALRLSLTQLKARVKSPEHEAHQELIKEKMAHIKARKETKKAAKKAKKAAHAAKKAAKKAEEKAAKAAAKAAKAAAKKAAKAAKKAEKAAKKAAKEKREKPYHDLKKKAADAKKAKKQSKQAARKAARAEKRKAKRAAKEAKKTAKKTKKAEKKAHHEKKSAKPKHIKSHTKATAQVKAEHKATHGKHGAKKAAKHEAAKHEAAKHEAAKHEAAKHEAVKHEAAKHEAVKHEAAKHEAVKKEHHALLAQKRASPEPLPVQTAGPLTPAKVAPGSIKTNPNEYYSATPVGDLSKRADAAVNGLKEYKPTLPTDPKLLADSRRVHQNVADASAVVHSKAPFSQTAPAPNLDSLSTLPKDFAEAIKAEARAIQTRDAMHDRLQDTFYGNDKDVGKLEAELRGPVEEI